MYAALWRALPGPVWVRGLILLALVVGVLVLCFGWFFPWVAQFVPFNDTTVG